MDAKETGKKVLKIGGTIASVVGFWKKASRWLRRRRDKAAADEQREAIEARVRAEREKQRAEHELQYLSDQANKNRGHCSTPGCGRPIHHSGAHGPALKPWGEQ